MNDVLLKELSCGNYCDEEEVNWWQTDETCECSRGTCGEHCSECGMPLCPMCFEIGCGFCSECPTKHFKGY